MSDEEGRPANQSQKEEEPVYAMAARAAAAATVTGTESRDILAPAQRLPGGGEGPRE